nr:hypothetical protein [Tanacetum cinerariifolium]
KRCRSPTTLIPSSTPVSRLIAPYLADLPPHKRLRDSYSSKANGEEHMEIGTANAETVADLGTSDGVRAPIEDGLGMGVEVATSDIREEEKEFEAEAIAGGTMEIVVDLLVTGGIFEPAGGDAPDLEGTLYDISHYMSEEEFCHVRRDHDDTRARLRRLDSLVERRLGFPGNVIATEPTRLQDTVQIANNLMDQKLKGYAMKNAENKRKFYNSQKDNQALETREANRNIGLRNGNGNRIEGGNGNGNDNEDDRDARPVVRECTYRDFMKCQPLNFKGTEGVVGLIRWFQKMEIVFHINNCPEKYQVKYATCTLLNSALTWWNSHKRTIGVDAAFSILWRELMKLMAEVYCLRTKVQKMESELWNLTMVLGEEDRIEKFIRGLSDNIQGNVIATEPTRLQDTVQIANNLMDQKLKGYAMKNAENKRKFYNSQKDNRRQQPPNKRQNVGGQNVARAYTSGNNERRVYNGPLPLCNKSNHHAVIVCDEKIVRIPYGDEVLIVQGDRNGKVKKSKLSIISCTMTQKYIKICCLIFLAQVTKKETEDKSKEKRLEDVLTVRDFPEVFPKDLVGLPPTRQVEFQIDLVPSAAPVARASYRLAPSKLQELLLNYKNILTKDL